MSVKVLLLGPFVVNEVIRFFTKISCTLSTFLKQSTISLSLIVWFRFNQRWHKQSHHSAFRIWNEYCDDGTKSWLVGDRKSEIQWTQFIYYFLTRRGSSIYFKFMCRGIPRPLLDSNGLEWLGKGVLASFHNIFNNAFPHLPRETNKSIPERGNRTHLCYWAKFGRQIRWTFGAWSRWWPLKHYS